MEKLKKIFFPVDIALGVLIIAMIVLIVIVNLSKGSTKFSPSDKPVKTVEDTENGSQEIKTVYDNFEVSTDVTVSTKNPALTDPSKYFFANSGTTALTESDLAGLDAECLYYAKCEIYARHGYVFTDATTNAFFTAKSWYAADSAFDLSTLTEVETNNYNLIETYMTNNNLTFTP